jgi:Lon protease-like protein
MRRRAIIRLLAAGAVIPWIQPRLSAGLLQTTSGNGGGESPARTEPEPQGSPQAEALLALFPLPVVLFPRANLPLHIFEERYKAMIHDCLKNSSEFGMLLAEGGSLGSVGCTASIWEVVREYPDGRMDILVRGKRRFEIASLNREKPYLRGKPQFFDDDPADPPADELRQQAVELHRRLTELTGDGDASKEGSPEAGDPQLSFQIIAALPMSLEWKQSMLELRSERQRLARVVRELEQWVEFLQRAPGRRAPRRRDPATAA